MPNWCHNELEVIGPEEEVIAFVNKARELPTETEHPQPFFFASFIPEPDYKTEEIDPLFPELSKEAKGDWWDWRVRNWGTKWEPNFGSPLFAFGAEGADPHAEKDKLNIRTIGNGESLVSYEFDTAWAPPVPVIESAAKQHPDLFFRLVYGEPGEDFGGKIEWTAGEESHSEEGLAADYLSEEKMWF